MGPGRNQQREAAKAVKPGQIPKFQDGDDGRVYRCKVVDWVLYIAAVSGKGVMSFRQQFYALVMNVEGNARLRLDSLARRVPAEINQVQFNEIVDILLCIIDPIDREVQFLNTSEAWKRLQAWEHRAKKTFEEYWLSYLKLSVEYLELHTSAENNIAVLELIAQTCEHNAKLSRSEFTSVLQGAMHWQEIYNRQEMETEKALNTVLLRRPVRVGPPTASMAMRGEQALSIAAPPSHVSRQEEVSDEPGEEAVDQTVDVSGTDTAQSMITNMRLLLDDVQRENQAALEVVQQQMTKLSTAMSEKAEEGSSAVGLTAELAADISDALQDLRV